MAPKTSRQRKKFPIIDALCLARPRLRYTVIFGMFMAALFELIGLAMIIPLLAAVTGLREGKVGLVTAINSAMETIGLSNDPKYILALILTGLTLKAIISIAVTRYVSDIVSDIGYGVQTKIVRSLLRANWGFFVRQPLGRLTHATGAEAMSTGEVFFLAASIVTGLMEATLFLIVCCLLSWQLTVLGVSVGALMLLSQNRLIRNRRLATRAHREQLRQTAGNFTDAMIGIKPLRAMGRTDRFTELFEADAQRTRETLKTKLVSAEYITEIQEPLIAAIIATTFYIALGAAELSVLQLILACVLFVRMIGTLAGCQKKFLAFDNAYDHYIELTGLLKQIEDSTESQFGTRFPQFEKAIEFNDVYFEYGPHKVLDGVSLTIRNGEITAVIGPSGAGKSTLIDLVVGLYRPRKGTISVDGVALNEIDIAVWRGMIGYVPQEISLFHDTIFNNVSLREENITEDNVKNALIASGAWSFVSQLPKGVHSTIGERGNLLSGGQRQRISLARALVHQPKLIILDEATTGLDRQTESQICDTIRQLSRQQGLTVIAISHQPGWIDVADTIFHMDDGKTVEGSATSDDSITLNGSVGISRAS